MKAGLVPAFCFLSVANLSLRGVVGAQRPDGALATPNLCPFPPRERGSRTCPQNTYPPPHLFPHTPRFPRITARSRRTVGGGTGWREGRLPSDGMTGLGPGISPGSMLSRIRLHRCGTCDGAQQGRGRAGWRGGSKKDSSRRFDYVAESPETWGKACFIFHRRTTGTEAILAPCRSTRQRETAVRRRFRSP